MEIRIPSGTRDLTGQTAAKKRWLEQTILPVFEQYGFQEVMTPAFEYYQNYNRAFSSLEERQMYKFFDENQDILCLRMDMTVPIARIAATKYKDAPLPLRFCYSSNVYKIRQTFAGKRSEVTDCGVELLGVQDAGDLEVLCCALDTLEALSLQDAVLEIGDVNFFSLAAGKVFDDPLKIARLASLIDRKSLVELEAFLDGESLEKPVRDFFMGLPWLSGTEEVLKEAVMLAFDQELEDVVLGLASLYDALDALGYSKNIRFDLGKIPHLNYYTGLIFEAFTPGVGTSILSGGRYDTLVKKFGRDLPAVGFSVKLDYLLDSVKIQNKTGLWKIYYPEDRMVEAFMQAKALRQKGIVELVEWDREEIVEENIL